MMQQIDISEARTHLPTLLEAALNGAEIIITEHNQPVVRLAHIEPPTGKATNGAVLPAVSETVAQAEASLFLSDHLPDRISASTPVWDGVTNAWRVPVIFAYPQLGVLGQVGEVVVSAANARILTHTPVEQMRRAAEELIAQHHDALAAPLS